MIRYLGHDRPLTDVPALHERLADTGLGATGCASKAALFARAATALAAHGHPSSEADQVAFFVPGRIEVLGKHTDYAGGRSMVAATEPGFCVVAAPRSDDQVCVVLPELQEMAQFAIDPRLETTVGHWSNYPRTVVRRVAQNFAGARRGVTLSLVSDLPPAAGMSSSSAFMVSVFLAISCVEDLPASAAYRENIRELTDLAGYLGTIENGQSFGTLVGDRGVGTFGGSEDHTAMLCGRAGHVSQYLYRPVRFERAIAVPAGFVFAVASSGVTAEKTGAALAKYNRVSGLVARIEELWARHTGGERQSLASTLAGDGDSVRSLAALLAVPPEAAGPGALRDPGDPGDPGALSRRLEHFLAENDSVIPAASAALSRGDLESFGHAVDESQRLAETLLGNQVPETSYLARSARELGAVAASAFGAGFGGSVWALVRDAEAASFLSAWGDRYRERFPGPAPASAFLLTGAGPGAFRVR